MKRICRSTNYAYLFLVKTLKSKNKKRFFKKVSKRFLFFQSCFLVKKFGVFLLSSNKKSTAVCGKQTLFCSFKKVEVETKGVTTRRHTRRKTKGNAVEIWILIPTRNTSTKFSPGKLPLKVLQSVILGRRSGCMFTCGFHRQKFFQGIVQFCN